MRVSVIGGGSVTDEEWRVAEDLGRVLGERDHAVVCGGLGGVMEAVCAGASDAGGETIGILPGSDLAAANEHVDVAVATGLGHARNALVPLNGDAVVAVAGGPGTLSEIGFAAIYDRPIAGIGTHDLPAVQPVETPAAAVDHVESAVDHVG